MALDNPAPKNLVKETCTTCPYCGVGCGVIAKVDDAGMVTVRGDENHPANFGKLCSKGSALAETLGDHNRLLYPQMNGERVTWDTALDHMAERFNAIIKEHGPDAVAFYVSGQFLTEDYYIANKLMKGYIGSGNIDTNSRLCMASSVVGHKRAFGADTVPGNYEDLEEADLIVLTGSNLAWCHPILYQRILRARESNPNLKIINIDPRRTASCDQAELHLALKPGSDVILFEGLFKYLDDLGLAERQFIENHTNGIDEVRAKAAHATLDKVVKETALSKQDLLSFYQSYAATDKVVTIYSQGINQASDGTDRVNAIINCHLLTGRIGGIGQGPFSVTGQPNAMGGREVGGLANQLASHMDIGNPKHRDLVQRFWKSPTMAPKAGLTAVDMFDAVHAGKIKAIWIMATNPAVSMPNADHVKEALEKCDLVIVSDIYKGTDTGACANILLPATGWGEKDGMVTNSERRMSRQRAFLPALGESRHDWWQLCELGKRMGYSGFDFDGPLGIFDEYAALCAFENDFETGVERDLDLSGLTGLNQQEYDGLAPVQWPVTSNYPEGRTRLFDDGRFFTADHKACFVGPKDKVTDKVGNSPIYTFHLNTGRIRDHWHTMTRTGRAARLSNHLAEPFVEIHPDDAARQNLTSADIAEIRSEHGMMRARVVVTDRQKQGELFAPMHFTQQFSSHGRVDSLTPPIVDPFSLQPALKSARVSIEKLDVAAYGYAAISGFAESTVPEGLAYWAKAEREDGVSLELAFGEASEDYVKLFEGLLSHNLESQKLDILDYKDPADGSIRLAAFEGETLMGLLFISKSPVALSRGWAASQLGNSFSGAERLRILAGRPGADMPDKGAIICSCMNIGMNEIREAVSSGCETVDAVGDCTTAGTNCGSCQSEIRDIIAAMQADMPKLEAV